MLPAVCLCVACLVAPEVGSHPSFRRPPGIAGFRLSRPGFLKELNENIPTQGFSSKTTFIRPHPISFQEFPAVYTQSRLPGWAFGVIDKVAPASFLAVSPSLILRTAPLPSSVFLKPDLHIPTSKPPVGCSPSSRLQGSFPDHHL